MVRTRERSSVERIRIALMEKRVMLGDIFARFGVGRWALLGEIGRMLREMGSLAPGQGARLRLFFKLLGAAPLHD